jgi:hypothetical protein
MKKLLLGLRTSPLMFTLLSLGITPPRSRRVVKVPISQRVTAIAATHRRLIDQPRRWAENE